MVKIGSISACIAGDHRYTERLEVFCDGNTCEVRYQDTGAVGGMDGPGGAYSNPWKVLTVVSADAKSIANAVRNACNENHVIREYGKPSKYFYWGTYACGIIHGISIAKVEKTLQKYFGSV